jgi:hypothetical protein
MRKEHARENGAPSRSGRVMDDALRLAAVNAYARKHGFYA